MVQIAAGPADGKPTFPGWELLRALGGEIVEVSVLGRHASAGEPGKDCGLVHGGDRVLQVTFLPAGPKRRTADGHRRPGPANRRRPACGAGLPGIGTTSPAIGREESWLTWDPWPALVKRFDAAAAGAAGSPAWLDAVRGLELDDAARRGVERPAAAYWNTRRR